MYENGLQGSRVTEGLAQVTGDFVLRREIDLLEKLRGDRQAAGCSDAVQCVGWVHVVIKVVLFAKPSAFACGGALAIRKTYHCDRC